MGLVLIRWSNHIQHEAITKYSSAIEVVDALEKKGYAVRVYDVSTGTELDTFHWPNVKK